jgi:hypothetical protein
MAMTTGTKRMAALSALSARVRAASSLAFRYLIRVGVRVAKKFRI